MAKSEVEKMLARAATSQHWITLLGGARKLVELLENDDLVKILTKTKQGQKIYNDIAGARHALDSAIRVIDQD